MGTMRQMALSNISLGDRTIGAGSPTYIIAEVGANHNGSWETACEFVRLASKAGADAVKFQAYSRETLFAERLPDGGSVEARHNNELLRRRWEILPQFTAPDSWWKDLKVQCAESGVDFLCTPFDFQRLHLLDNLGVPAHKIASGDITWLEFLAEVGSTGKPVMLSTGASTLAEVERALETLELAGCQELVLLHCVSNYPPKWEDANLRALETLHQAFQAPVGLSDHSPGSTLPIAAVSLGACLVEKHITLDRKQNGLDHHFALEIDEFARLVEDIRHVESALGTGRKIWVEDEREERYWVRRGIWLKTDVEANSELKRENLDILRPKQSLGAEELDMLLGRIARKNLSAGMPLNDEDVKKGD